MQFVMTQLDRANAGGAEVRLSNVTPKNNWFKKEEDGWLHHFLAHFHVIFRAFKGGSLWEDGGERGRV